MLSSHLVGIWKGLRRVGFGLSLRGLACRGREAVKENAVPAVRLQLRAVRHSSCPDEQGHLSHAPAKRGRRANSYLRIPVASFRQFSQVVLFGSH
jgi:hypothetical protein